MTMTWFALFIFMMIALIYFMQNEQASRYEFAFVDFSVTEQSITAEPPPKGDNLMFDTDWFSSDSNGVPPAKNNEQPGAPKFGGYHTSYYGKLYGTGYRNGEGYGGYYEDKDGYFGHTSEPVELPPLYDWHPEDGAAKPGTGEDGFHNQYYAKQGTLKDKMTSYRRYPARSMQNYMHTQRTTRDPNHAEKDYGIIEGILTAPFRFIRWLIWVLF